MKRRVTGFLVLAALTGLLACARAAPGAEEADAVGTAEPPARRFEAVDLTDFRDGIHHARMTFDAEKPPYPVHEPHQIVAIADAMLAFQRSDGGWPKNVDYLRVRSPAELEAIRARSAARKGGTLDNRNVWTQVRYLARVHRQTRMERHAAAAARGLEWILARRHKVSGGWRGSDVDAVTYNDDVMAGVLGLLRDVVQGEPEFAFLDDGLRERCRAAWDRGLACVLRTQVRVGGRLTVWGQQHDHRTGRPVKARSFELASLTSAESVGVVRLLMSIEDPGPEVKASIRAAVRWFHAHRIEGVRIATIRAERKRYAYHVTAVDRVVVADPDAPPVWTRFYDLETGRPVFFTRDSRTVTDYAEVSRERRTGYGYWVRNPARLLEKDYPAWRRRHDPAHDVLAAPAPALTYGGTTVPPETVADQLVP